MTSLGRQVSSQRQSGIAQHAANQPANQAIKRRYSPSSSDSTMAVVTAVRKPKRQRHFHPGPQHSFPPRQHALAVAQRRQRLRRRYEHHGKRPQRPGRTEPEHRFSWSITRACIAAFDWATTAGSTKSERRPWRPSSTPPARSCSRPCCRRKPATGTRPSPPAKTARPRITLTLPERSTAWKFLAKGLSTETLAGEATDDLTVKKDLFGEIKLPLAFTDGDTAEIPVTVHNETVEKGPIEVVLRTTIAGRRVEETKTIEVTSKGMHEVSFKAELKRPALPKGEGSEIEAVINYRTPKWATGPTTIRPIGPISSLSSARPVTKTSSSVRCRCVPTACRCSPRRAVRARPTAPSGWRPPRA